MKSTEEMKSEMLKAIINYYGQCNIITEEMKKGIEKKILELIYTNYSNYPIGC